MNRQQVERERKRKKLEQLKYLENNIKRLQIKIRNHESMIHELTGAKAVTISDMPKGGIPIEFTDIVNKRLDWISELSKELDMFRKRYIKIEKAIENLTEADHKIVLKHRYLDYYTVPETAREMILGEDTIKKLQRKAIDLLNI